MEAINCDKYWEEIKDLLRLKLCDTNIHTYTLHFMESNSRKMNPLQPMSTGSKLKQRDVILQMMLPPLGFL